MQTWFADPRGLPVRISMLAALILTAFGLLSLLWRRRGLARLGSRLALHLLLARNRPRLFWRFVRGACSTLGLILLVVGIAGPQWGRDWEKSVAPGRDLVAVLDLSRSMLAEDVPPSANRLAKAKAAVTELSETIQKRGGYRLALVAFTDRPLVICPLTHDYDLFRAKLAELSYAGFCSTLERMDAAEQRSLKSPSGTRIGAALRKAVEMHDARYRGFQEILMISDGDDPAGDNEWRTGIDEARKHGIPVHTVGIGNPHTGSRIPLPVRYVINEDGRVGEKAYLMYEGKEVRTQLQEKPLEELARRTGGTYTAARTNDLDLGELFHDVIEPRGLREETDEALTLPVYQQRYSWFFGAAFGLLVTQLLIGHYRRPTIAQSPFLGWLRRRARAETAVVKGKGNHETD